MRVLTELLESCAFKLINGGKCPVLIAIKDDYKNRYGISSTKAHCYKGSMNERSGIKIADAYTQLAHAPDDELVKAAYEQLAKELIQQFEFLNEREEIVYEPFEGKGEPYKNSFEMLKDIHNYHLYFFKTEYGFGETDYRFKNKMLDKTGIKYKGYELVINDLFRIVHDVFGHAMKGHGFGPVGEDKAWFSHIEMFTPLAAAALTTETRGQNCWVNFGSHLRDKFGNLRGKNDPEFIAPQDRPFAVQKMNLMPAHISGIDVRKEYGNIEAAFIPLWNPLMDLHRNKLHLNY